MSPVCGEREPIMPVCAHDSFCPEANIVCSHGICMIDLNHKMCLPLSTSLIFLMVFQILSIFLSLFPVLKVKMDHLLVAAQWICRRVQGLCSIPPSPKVAGGSLSSTAPTPTTICHLRLCHAIPLSTVRGKQPHHITQHMTHTTYTLYISFHTAQLHDGCEALCRICFYPVYFTQNYQL